MVLGLEAISKYGVTQFIEPIHRWCSFSDSWPPAAVSDIMSLVGVKGDDWIWDPFGGSGTTAVVAKGKGLCSLTSDSDPLSVLVTRIKTHPPSGLALQRCVWPKGLNLTEVMRLETKRAGSSRVAGVRTMQFLVAASILRSGWHLGEAFEDRRVRAEFAKLKSEMSSDRPYRASQAGAFVYHRDFLAQITLVRRLTSRQVVLVTSPPFPESNENPKLVQLKDAIGLRDKQSRRPTLVDSERYGRMLESIAGAAAQVGCRAVAVELTARQCGDRLKSPPELLLEALDRTGYEASIAPFSLEKDDPTLLCLGVRRE